jgi:hypothetical protein
LSKGRECLERARRKDRRDNLNKNVGHTFYTAERSVFTEAVR